MNLWFLYLLCAFSGSQAYNVLVVYPFPVRSLNNLGEGIVRLLLNAGHEVTYITCYPRKINNPKLRQIDISKNNELLANDNHMNISFLLEQTMEPSGDLEYLQELGVNIALMTFENPNVQNLLKNPKENFDVVIADILESELYAGFAALYDCPLIWAYSMGAHWVTIRLVNEPTNPAYSSDYFSPIEVPFSISERFLTLYNQIWWRYAKYFKTMPKEKAAYERFFGPEFAKRGKPLPDYEEVIYNASLVISNEHHATGKIAETPQNWKLVGGFYIEDPPVPLPKYLQDIMDNAVHGVIYFSMGSVWRSELIPKELTDSLLKLFGELKATVLWKYEADLPNLPKNVHTIKWAPQQSILAHPNCKVFVSHGGLLSSTEAIHFGVPTIGVPISYDQFINIGKAVKKGYAIKVDLSYNLAKDLKSAINVIFNNPTYKERAKELSAIYHDRPVSPAKETVHWIEHVVRTKGAPHLRPPSLLAPAYQKLYLDVAALIFGAIGSVIMLWKNVFGGQKQKTKKAKRS